MAYGVRTISILVPEQDHADVVAEAKARKQPLADYLMMCHYALKASKQSVKANKK